MNHPFRNSSTPIPRRGVTSVLAMMFLVIFGSLSVAMAIMAQGNLRAADSALHVSRATSAAQTGLVFATRRLQSESKRWVVRKGTIDRTFGEDLWSGELSIDGEEIELLAAEGYETGQDPSGLVDGLLDAHLADDHAFEAEPGDSLLPTTIGSNRLETQPIRMNVGDDDFYFRLRYETVESDDDETRIRVTSIGFDGEISRQVAMEFLLTKKIPYAVVSPNRIMIGKNVSIEGPMGTRFGLNPEELNESNGDPLVMRSDFRYLSDSLTEKIDLLEEAIAETDLDGDGRLRPNHPVEGLKLTGDSGLSDTDGDQYVTGFDLFLAEYDLNGDNKVVWDSERANLAGLGTPAEEFQDVDNQLARLIDQGFADRNLDGTIDSMDVALGYNDGLLDAYDMYAKVRGALAFGVTEEDWDEVNQGPWRNVVEGAVVPEIDQSAVTFDVSEEILRDVTTEMFEDNQEWYLEQVQDSSEFQNQVDQSVLNDEESEFSDAENSSWESVPFGSPNPYDWFQRDVYKNMTFRNLRIPPGNNGRFINCTFIGTTYVQTEVNCIHPNWNYLGALQRTTSEDGEIIYETKFEGLEFAPGPDGEATVEDTKLLSNNLIFEGCTFLGAIAGDRPSGYTHWRNKLQFTGATRFYLNTDDPSLSGQDDAEMIMSEIESFTEEENDYFARSTMMMPGWSIDVGNFENSQAEDWEDTPAVNLKGIIVAGILDARGTVNVTGTLLMTFRPTPGTGPLFYGGTSDQFNTTLGYFGPLDGDMEGPDPDGQDFNGFGEIRLIYDSNARLPDGIPWPITVEADATTYTEGAYQ